MLQSFFSRLISKNKEPWYHSGAVYQIYPRSFQDSNGDGIGDLRGIINRLDYIKSLGVSAIWLCPIYASPDDDNGYDISDYKAIHPDFGTMEDFDELLQELHKRDLKLILDMVFNHSSDEHPWFQEAVKNPQSEKRNWYIWSKGKDGQPPNAWGSYFGGPAWQLDSASGEYYLHLFSKKQPDLNWENKALRKELYSIMRWWLAKGVDGLRLDVINQISKTLGFPEGKPVPGSVYTSGFEFWANGPRIHEFFKEMNKKVFKPFKAMTVGETSGVSPELAAIYTDPKQKELDMIFQFEMVGIDCGPKGKFDLKTVGAPEINAVSQRWQYGLAQKGWNSLYWNNHDQPRVVSRFGNDQEARERSGKMLAAYLYLQKGTPFIYQGEEIGMINYPFQKVEELRDLESLNFIKEAGESSDWTEAEIWKGIRARGRDNARTPFCWDGSNNAGFTKGTPWINVHPAYDRINLQESQTRKDSLLNFYRELLAFRKAEPLVGEGEIEFLNTLSPDLVLYRRFSKKHSHKVLWVGCNMSDKNIKVETSEPQYSCDPDIGEDSPVLKNYSEVSDCALWRPWEFRVWYTKA